MVLEKSNLFYKENRSKVLNRYNAVKCYNI